MIPVATTATETDTLPGEEVEFTIGNAYWVMKSLSKLYSNPILATIREYSTNARDSQDEAGKKSEPIRVTLPSVYHPYFEVEDFGVGMSEAELKTTYTQFGTSTKRESADTNGMLGFGSKSALAYTDTFTIVSRKDGIQTTAVVSRKADFSKVTLKVIPALCGLTDEPNGVKVQIPSRDYDAFHKIAMDFYRFWEPGTVLVDGVQPEWAVGEKLDDNLYYSRSEGTSYVVMGKVAYRIANPDALFRNRGMRSIPFVAYVPNSSVEFTPSREDLEYTEHTKKTLHGVIDNFEKKMLAAAKADINTATDYFDAYSKWKFWSDKLGKGPFGDLEFKGEKFVDEIPFTGYRYRPAESRYNMYSINGWQVSNMASTLIVTGMPSGSPNSHHKGRAKQYRNIKDIKASYILFTEDAEVKSVWIDPRRVVDWEIVKQATKKPRQKFGPYDRPKRIRGTFDYWTKAGMSYEKELPDTKELYYITAANNKTYGVRDALTALDDNGVVVVLAKNRVEKFKRDNPQVQEFHTAFKARVELDGSKFIDANTKKALALGSQTRQWLRHLPVDKINDPEFANMKALLDHDTNSGLAAYNRAFRLACALGMRYTFKEHGIRPVDESLVNRYPLLNSLSRYSVDSGDTVLYINAKFAEGKKKGNK